MHGSLAVLFTLMWLVEETSSRKLEPIKFGLYSRPGSWEKIASCLWFLFHLGMQVGSGCISTTLSKDHSLGTTDWVDVVPLIRHILRCSTQVHGIFKEVMSPEHQGSQDQLGAINWPELLEFWSCAPQILMQKMKGNTEILGVINYAYFIN